jgi:hypothetical protein
LLCCRRFFTPFAFGLPMPFIFIIFIDIDATLPFRFRSFRHFPPPLAAMIIFAAAIIDISAGFRHFRPFAAAAFALFFACLQLLSIDYFIFRHYSCCQPFSAPGCFRYFRFFCHASFVITLHFQLTFRRRHATPPMVFISISSAAADFDITPLLSMTYAAD